jgi:hypothetical protein
VSAQLYGSYSLITVGNGSSLSAKCSFSSLSPLSPTWAVAPQEGDDWSGHLHGGTWQMRYIMHAWKLCSTCSMICSDRPHGCLSLLRRFSLFFLSVHSPLCIYVQAGRLSTFYLPLFKPQLQQAGCAVFLLPRPIGGRDKSCDKHLVVISVEVTPASQKSSDWTLFILFLPLVKPPGVPSDSTQADLSNNSSREPCHLFFALSLLRCTFKFCNVSSRETFHPFFVLLLLRCTFKFSNVSSRTPTHPFSALLLLSCTLKFSKVSSR